MHLIVTGPDKAGKTSLVKELKEILNMVEIDVRNRGDQGNRLATNMILDILTHNPEHKFILDRFHPFDDRVYNPVIEGRQTIFDTQSLERIERRLANMNSILVVVTADKEVIQKRYEEAGGDEYAPIDKLDELNRSYSIVAKTTSLPVVWIDTSGKSVSRSTDELLDKLEEVR